MFDDMTGNEFKEGEDDLFWAEMVHGWMQLGPLGGEGADVRAERAVDDLSERLRRSGGRLPGSDPRR